jgi:hypothetical protein
MSKLAADKEKLESYTRLVQQLEQAKLEGDTRRVKLLEKIVSCIKDRLGLKGSLRLK